MQKLKMANVPLPDMTLAPCMPQPTPQNPFPSYCFGNQNSCVTQTFPQYVIPAFPFIQETNFGNGREEQNDNFMSQGKRNKKQKKKKSDWKLDRCYICKEKGHFPVKCPVRAADTRALMAPYLAEINDQLNWVINKLTRYEEYERQTQQAALETYSFVPVQPAQPSTCDTSNFNGISEIPVIASSSTERQVPRDRRVCVHLEVGGRRLHTLVDTGASRSLIRKDVWTDICRGMHRTPLLFTGEVLQSLSGHALPTRGRSCITVSGKSVYVYVIDELFHDLLLGGDALDILGAVIDYRHHTVTMDDKKFEYEDASNKDRMLASAKSESERWVELFPDVFSTLGPLRSTHSVSMVIDTGNAMPINQRPYRLPLRKRQIVNQEIDKMLQDGIIEPSMSSWASPITLVPKKDGSIRFCVDYRKLNSITKKDAHPLPHIQDIFDTFTGATVFSTLDLKSGYWQVPMHPDSVEKTAFVCHRGLFNFRRMPFGCTNAPAVFQRLMNSVLADYIGKSVMVYLDDIVVFSRTREEHDQHLVEVFTALQAHQLTIKLSKCNFGQKEVKLLGFIVSGQGIRSDPEKVSAIQDMAPPEDARAVRAFLGVTGYYRQCIPDYARIAHPLVKLTKKYAPFRWGDAEHQAWERLRDVLVSDNVMAYPQLDKPYKLYTDACDYAVGAILCQEDENGVERPVQYISKQLSGSALNWATIEKEAFAVVHALNKLRPYLYGAKFTIYTDHKPLKSLFLSEVKNTKIQRWAVLLAEYGAPIEYRQGPNNVRADMLSRIRPWMNVSRDSETICAVEEEEEIPWEFDQLEKEQIGREQRQTEEFRLGMDDEEGYAVNNGLLYTLVPPPGKAEYPRLVLPPSARYRVIRRAHTEVGHQGMRKTIDRLQEAYKWPGMRGDVYKTISKCARCAVHRTQKDRVAPTAMPIAQYPSQIVGMDMCGPFPESRHGNKYILTIIDHCTGWVDVKPLPNKTAENVVSFLESEYIPRYGPPEVMITDQGLEFKNRTVEGYLKSLGVDVRHSSPFHPQTNGKIERFHRTFKAILRKFINARPGEWEDHLGPTLWAHRVSTSTVTGYTPYFLTYGRKPRVPFSRIFPALAGAEENILGTRLLELTEAFREAAVRTEESRRYNYKRLQERARAGDLKVGDSVVILANESSPLDPKWDHGYTVVGIRGSVVTAVGPGNRRRVVNREKVRLVDSEADWNTLRMRQTRAYRGKQNRQRQFVRPAAPVPRPDVAGDHVAGHRCPKRPRVDDEPDVQERQQPPDLTGALCDQDIRPPDLAQGSKRANDPTSGTDHPIQRTGMTTRAQARQLREQTAQKRSAENSPFEAKEQRLNIQPEPAEAQMRDMQRHNAEKRSAEESSATNKRQKWYAPLGPAKRLASTPDPELVQAEKRRCVEFVYSFFASLI